MTNNSTDSTVELKRRAAEYAADLVESNMVVGLGTGSTAKHAVLRIASRLRSGELHNIVGIPTSTRTDALARENGIPLADFSQHLRIDLTIDGADEVDPDFHVIKGGGGALLREKIVAQATDTLIIVVDDSKMVPALGTGWAIPVEVVTFGWESQADFLEKIGAEVKLRKTADGSTFLTDHHNFILDANFGPIQDLEGLTHQLEKRTGIVEHGIFMSMTDAVAIASSTGVEYRKRPE